MSKIMLNTEKLWEIGKVVEQTQSSMQQIAFLLNARVHSLNFVEDILQRYDERIHRQIQNISNQASQCGAAASYIFTMAERYERTENIIKAQIADGYSNSFSDNSDNGAISQAVFVLPGSGIYIYFFELLRRLIEKFKEDTKKKTTVVFDDEGQYGGDQGAPAASKGEDRRRLTQIIQRYYPNLKSEEQIDAYLRKLNSEGCGYVALINTIFDQYIGREEEFEKTFGFPMYRDGELNYNELLVDFYSATDNHKKDSSGKDYIDANEDPSATKGKGTTLNKREYRWEMYLEDHGVKVDVKNEVNITQENFDTYKNEGGVIVRIEYDYMYWRDENGNMVRGYLDGGHAMTVTGFTEDGMLIVSSWGKEYYIYPDANGIKYQVVSYK